MAEYPSAQQAQFDLVSKLRDIEEKQRLARDRMLLLGKSVIEERSNSFKELQELKKTVLEIKEENKRIKEILSRTTEQLNNIPRREEVAIIQRQLDMLRKA